MDSEEDLNYESGEEETDDEDFVDIAMEQEPSSTSDARDSEEYHYEVLTADKIVHVMVECIKEVNAVVQVCFGIIVWFKQS